MLSLQFLLNHRISTAPLTRYTVYQDLIIRTSDARPSGPPYACSCNSSLQHVFHPKTAPGTQPTAFLAHTGLANTAIHLHIHPMPDTIPQALLTLHIAAGITSLVLFWIPIVTKKGRSLHLKFGTAYVYAMYSVLITAIILSVIRFLAGSYQAGLALFFLGVLTAVPLLSGIQILKAKKPTAQYKKLRLFLAGLLLATSVILIVASQILDSGLMLGFALIGLLGSLGDLYRFARSTGSGKSWLREHYEGMLFSGGAAYTAFLAFGGRTVLGDILTGWWTLVPWLLPTFLTIALLPLVHKRFKQAKKVA